MIPRTVTFRCSEAQAARLEKVMQRTAMSRAALINDSLEDFLDFAESPEIRALDLFGLVESVDAQGEGCLFSDQA